MGTSVPVALPSVSHVYLLESLFRKLLPVPTAWCGLLIFSSGILKVLGLQSILSFGFSLILLHVNAQLAQHYLLERCSFSQCVFLCRFRRAQQFGLIPGSSALSHCFTCLSLCKYHGVWVTMTLYYILKSDIVLYKALYICINFPLFVQHNTWFQNMIFRSKPINPELRFPAIFFPTCARSMFTCCNPHRARYQIAKQGLVQSLLMLAVTQPSCSYSWGL